jgi:hypothetical protein
MGGWFPENEDHTVKATLDMSRAYVPTVKQQVIHEKRADIKALESARRSGKSRASFGEMVLTYVEALNTKRGPEMVEGFNAWVVIPSQQQGLEIWREITHNIKNVTIGSVPIVEEIKETDRVIILKGSPNWDNGNLRGYIRMKQSFDPENLQSTGLDFLWLCEAQDISEEAFAKVFPSRVSKNRLGRVIAEGIPARHPDHWFWKLYDTANRGGHYQMWGYKMTYRDNPLLTEQQKQEIEVIDKSVLSDAAWRRMYLAERNAAGQAFKNVDECIYGDMLIAPLPGRGYVAGLDIGVAQDPSELCIMDENERHVVAWHTWKPGERWTQQREAIIALCQEWDFTQLVFDASSLGGKMAESELADAGIPIHPVTFTGRAQGDEVVGSRTDLLGQLALAFERMTVSFPKVGTETLVSQLRAFEHRKTRGGNWHLAVPETYHDDAVFALALALAACEPASEVAMYARRGNGSRRYLPTQLEAQGGVRAVPQTVLLRQHQRNEERWEMLREAGFEV